MIFNVSDSLATYQVYLFKFFTILSYTNSAINPFLYAFTNDAFKSAFTDAFSCVVSERSRVAFDGGGQRRDEGVGGKRAAVVEVQAAVPKNHTGRQDHGSVVQLEMTTRQTQERQLHVVTDLVATADSNDVDSRMLRVTVHLEDEHQQQQQPHQKQSDGDDECSV